MTTNEHETTECTLCDDGTEMETAWLPAHVVSNHGNEPRSVRTEYPNLYESLTKVVDEEFGSFEELMDIARSDDRYLAELREDYFDGMVPEHGSSPPSEEPTSTTTDGPVSLDRVSSTDEEEASDAEDGDRPVEGSSDDGEGLDGSLSGGFGGIQDKWFFLGVGGCGGNLVDSVLLRQNALRRDDAIRTQLWESGLHDAAVVNTNRGELGGTVYAREYVDGNPSEVAMDYSIGDGGGAGTDPMEAIAKLESDMEEYDLFRGHWPKLEDVDISEGIMLLHSAVKGTGTGASPLLTEEIKSDKAPTSPVFHFIVLPDPSNLDGNMVQQFNGLFGVTTAAQHADAVIVVDNDNLRESTVEVDLADYDEYKDGYEAENRSALAFLEGFAVSSIVPPGDDDPIAAGDMFDLEDAFGPVTRFYSDGPAPILAPALGEARGGIENRQQLKKFIHSTLETGKLADFDPETAWGMSLLFYGPADEISRTIDIGRGNMTSILDEMSIEFDFTEAHPGPVHDYYVSVEGMETTRLWVIMWNPRMKRLEETKELADTWSDRLDDMPILDEMERREEQFDELFEFLGVDYFKPDGEE